MATALRKCPNCKDTVGAESDECPRCGVNFRAAMMRRVLFWSVLAVLALLALAHFAFKWI